MLCAGLGWAKWWHPRALVETDWSPHACLEIQPLSPVFLSPLHPSQHLAVFIQLTHEEILHKSKKLPAPAARKKSHTKAGIKENRRQHNKR